MTRGLWPVALAAAMLAAPGMAQDDAHRHGGLIFHLRVSPDLNDYTLYRAYLADPDDPASLLVERGGGYLGNDGPVDLTPAQCPALGRAVAALGELALPAVHIGAPQRYAINAVRGTEYDFSGFIGFANGGEGELRILTYDVPDTPAEPQLEWARGFVQAFEACRAGPRP
jgi:hypothetical protein